MIVRSKSTISGAKQCFDFKSKQFTKTKYFPILVDNIATLNYNNKKIRQILQKKLELFGT